VLKFEMPGRGAGPEGAACPGTLMASQSGRGPMRRWSRKLASWVGPPGAPRRVDEGAVSLVQWGADSGPRDGCEPWLQESIPYLGGWVPGRGEAASTKEKGNDFREGVNRKNARDLPGVAARWRKALQGNAQRRFGKIRLGGSISTPPVNLPLAQGKGPVHQVRA
jgi:hypothetical protein